MSDTQNRERRWTPVLRRVSSSHFQQHFSYIVAVPDKLYHILLYEYTLSWTGFELTTLVVIGTDCTGSCKSNYHTNMPMMAQPLIRHPPCCPYIQDVLHPTICKQFPYKQVVCSVSLCPFCFGNAVLSFDLRLPIAPFLRCKIIIFKIARLNVTYMNYLFHNLWTYQ
jgi:hypothetical protein